MRTAQARGFGCFAPGKRDARRVVRWKRVLQLGVLLPLWVVVKEPSSGDGAALEPQQ